MWFLNSIFEMLTNINVIFYLLAYLIGGIPFGLILAKFITKTDIRESGSGSIGATNVLRVLKTQNPKLAKKLALLTLILDISKGLSIIFISLMFDLSVHSQWAIGIFAILGHCFSPYLGFEGGKGVATAAGVLAWFLPYEMFIAFIVWFLFAKLIKISSVSSLGALISLIISSYILHPNIPNSHAPLFIISIIVIYKHVPNIIRLINGTEKQVV